MRRWRRLIGWIGYCLLRLLYSTIRVHVHKQPIGAGIIAFWHGHQLCLYGGLPEGGLVAPVSHSLDGELQVGVLGGFGIRAIRGSSSRGGATALLGLVKALRAGSFALMAVDGPRGPVEVPKLGAFFLAKKLGVPIYPVTSTCTRFMRLDRTWDKMRIPLPFSRIDVRFGDAIECDDVLSLDDFSDKFIVAIKRLSFDNERGKL